MNICILYKKLEFYTLHNFLLIVNACIDLGYSVYLGDIDSIYMMNSEILVQAIKVTEKISVGAVYRVELMRETLLTSNFDYIWLFSIGDFTVRQEKMQILWVLNKYVKFVNSIEGIQFLNNKLYLSYYKDKFESPETYYSNNFDFLWNIFTESNSKWIIKPYNGSFGRDVFILRRADTNSKIIIQHMTGNNTGQYCLMQKYITEIQNGEKRVIIANQEIICFYKKNIVLSNDHRTNVRQGGLSEKCNLATEEIEICKNVALIMKDYGISYFGIDLVYPYVMEINVVNAGGMINYSRLTGINVAHEVVKQIIHL